MQDFRKLKVWDKAHGLALAIYKATRPFPAGEQRGVGDQLRRSAISVASNIVEGTARGTDREAARFLRISLASAAELQYQLLLGYDLGLLTGDAYAALEAQVIEVKRMLSGFIRHLTAKTGQRTNAS
jgi:four helix bundle protein